MFCWALPLNWDAVEHGFNVITMEGDANDFKDADGVAGVADDVGIENSSLGFAINASSATYIRDGYQEPTKKLDVSIDVASLISASFLSYANVIILILYECCYGGMWLL